MKLTLSNILTFILLAAVIHLYTSKSSNTPVVNSNNENVDATIQSLSNKIKELEEAVELNNEINHGLKEQVSELQLELERTQNTVKDIQSVPSIASEKTEESGALPQFDSESTKTLKSALLNKLGKIESSLNLDEKKSRRMKRVADRFANSFMELHSEPNDKNSFERKKAKLYLRTNREVQKILSPAEYRKYLRAFNNIKE